MTQFLNWISNILFTQNETIIHFILIPACFIDNSFNKLTYSKALYDSIKY